MHVRIIANPISGGGRGPAAAEVLAEALRERSATCEVRITTSAGDARAWAGEPGADCVVSVGGDGTLNEIVNALIGTDTLIATLPMGTANVVARETGAPLDPVVLADLILQRKTKTIDVGRSGDRLFLLGAGAGLDASIVEAVHRTRGSHFSYFSYVLPAIRIIVRGRFPRISVSVDGEHICDDAQYVIVGNCQWSAGVFKATPKASYEDGLLDVCILRRLSVVKILWLILLAQLPGFADRNVVTYRQGTSVELVPATGERVPLQIDGDPADALPARFAVMPQALRLVAK